MQSNAILAKQKKDKTACCCGWGAVCQYIGRAFMESPAGLPFELYKICHVFIHHREDSIKANKMADVLRRHLSIERSLPKIFCVARHHFPIELLQWHETKKRQWLSPLTLEEAQQFGIANHSIDYHPDSDTKNNGKMLCQVPNNLKEKLLTLVKSFTSARGELQPPV